MAYWGQLEMNDGFSKVMQSLGYYHNMTLLVIFFVLLLVGFLMVAFIFKFGGLQGLTCGNIKSNESLETVWTFFPMFWLVLLGGPSLGILYSMEMSDGSYSLSFKALGHQWYWSYEYSYKGSMEEFGFMDEELGIVEDNVSFDSYMMSLEDTMGEYSGGYRLLEVDNRCVCPFNKGVRVLVSSEDVMHCWTVPSLGLKVDAIPGRVNSMNFSSFGVGVFYGQCSEICGANHSFMPIGMEIVLPKYLDFWWLQTFMGGIVGERV